MSLGPTRPTEYGVDQTSSLPSLCETKLSGRKGETPFVRPSLHSHGTVFCGGLGLRLKPRCTPKLRVEMDSLGPVQ